MSKRIRNTITLYDAFDSQYTLVMAPAKTTYVYNSDGKKINENDNLGVYTYNLYEDGVRINPTNIEIEWSTPLVMSMVRGRSNEKMFVPELLDEYKVENNDNRVSLKIKYKDKELKVTQPISIIKANRDGVDGENGESVKSVSLISSSLTIKYDKEGVPSPEVVEITAHCQNIKNKVPKWSLISSRGETLIEELDTTHGIYFSDDLAAVNPKLFIPHDAVIWESNSVIAIKVTIEGITDIVSLTKLEDGTQGETGTTYRNLGMWLYNERYGNVAKFIDLVRYDGNVYECIKECVGIKPTNEIYWRLFIEKGDPGPTLDWVKDWDSHKTQVGEDFIISPKIFLGQNGNPTGEASLTGIAIGRDVYGQTNGTIGIVGYNDNKHTFEMLTDGSAYFGVDPKRRFLINYDGSISTPDLTADTIKGGTLSVGGNIGEVSANEGIRKNVSGVIKVFDENTDLTDKTNKEIEELPSIVTIDKKGIYMTQGVIEGQKALFDVTGGSIVIGGNTIDNRPLSHNGMRYNNETGLFEIRASKIEFMSDGGYTDMDGFKGDITEEIKDMNDSIQTDIKDAIDEVNESIAEIVEDLNNMSADNIITPQEKITLSRQFEEIKSEYTKTKAQAELFFKGAVPPTEGNHGDLSVGSNSIHPTYQEFIDTYENKYETLDTYLDVIFANMRTESTINSTEFNSKFNDYFAAKVSLLEAMTTVNKNFASMFKMDTTSIELVVGSKNQENGKWNADGLLSKINISPGSMLLQANRINVKGEVTLEGYANGLADGTTKINGGTIETGVITLGGAGSRDPKLQIHNGSSIVTHMDKRGIATTGNFVIGSTNPSANIEDINYGLKFASGSLDIKAKSLSIEVNGSNKDVGAELTVTSNKIQTAVNDARSYTDGKIKETNSTITQTASAITSTVNANYTELDGKITSANSSITQNANAINLKVDKGNIISSINIGEGSVQIHADRISLGSGFTVTSSRVSGINADLVSITNLNASNITAGNISANRISGGTLSGITLDVSTNATVGGLLTVHGGAYGESGIRLRDNSRIFSNINCRLWNGKNHTYIECDTLAFGNSGTSAQIDINGTLMAVNNVVAFGKVYSGGNSSTYEVATKDDLKNISAQAVFG